MSHKLKGHLVGDFQMAYSRGIQKVHFLYCLFLFEESKSKQQTAYHAVFLNVNNV